MTESTTTPAPTAFDVERLRADFPALHQDIDGHPLVYLDNAATSQKPLAVLEAMEHFYRVDCANVHRGVHRLSMRATESYEGARRSLVRFLNADSVREMVFLRGTTEGINLVAQAWARPRLAAGDEIVVSHLEHHSNIVPWQILCEQTGAVLRVAPIDDTGEVDIDALEGLIGERTKVVSVGHVSNALGTRLPVRRIADAAHAVGAVIVVDGAQAAPHMRVDVKALDVDFYAVSGHKMYGPTGIGVLYGKEERLSETEPWMGGGDMILSVSFDGTTYNELPYKFEAGTPDIAGGIGLGAAAEYLMGLDFDAALAHEDEVLAYASAQLAALPGVRLIGTAPDKVAVQSFVMEGIHPHDVGTVLDAEGVAVRTGHHCAEPVMKRFDVAATVRASFGLYNTKAEVDALMRGLVKVQELFG